MSISFTVTLSARDWDTALGAWRCPALRIPGAVVDAAYVDGRQIDEVDWQMLGGHDAIRWAPEKHPEEITLSLRLTDPLTPETLTLRWKKLAIILPFVATICSVVLTALLTPLAKPTTSHANDTSASSGEQDQPTYHRSRAGAFVLGYETALVLAKANDGESEQTVTLSDHARIATLCGDLKLAQVTVPELETILEDPEQAIVSFAQAVMGAIDARDERLETAFYLGFFGMVSTNTPSQKPVDFDLRRIATKIGFEDQPDMLDSVFLEDLVRQAKLEMQAPD